MRNKFLKAAFTGVVLTVSGLANAALIPVSSYDYGTNAESQPQSTTFQSGSISDVGNLKLIDGLLATGSWNDGTNVGFRNDNDNGAPQARVIFDLGGLFDVSFVDVWSVTAFLGRDESVSISSSADGVLFGAPIVVNPLVWSGGFGNTSLVKATVDVSSLDDGQYYQVDFYDKGQWNMINEVQFDGVKVPEPSTLAILSLGLMGLASRRFKKQS